MLRLRKEAPVTHKDYKVVGVNEGDFNFLRYGGKVNRIGTSTIGIQGDAYAVFSKIDWHHWGMFDSNINCFFSDSTLAYVYQYLKQQKQTK